MLALVTSPLPAVGSGGGALGALVARRVAGRQAEGPVEVWPRVAEEQGVRVAGEDVEAMAHEDEEHAHPRGRGQPRAIRRREGRVGQGRGARRVAIERRELRARGLAGRRGTPAGATTSPS